MRHHYPAGGYERFLQAQKTFIRSSSKRRFQFHFFRWGLLLVGLSLLVVYAASDAVHKSWGLLLFVPTVGSFCGGLVGLILMPWQRRRSYRLYNGSPTEQRMAYLEVDGNILVSGIQGKAEARYERAAICDTVEDVSFILLFVRKNAFLYLPKQELPPELLNQLRSWTALPGAPGSC